jgi:hypothetical protein
MGAVILQISTDRDDFFMEIDEDRLKEIASRMKVGEDRDLATLDLMRKEVWESSKEARVHRTSEADYELVLDGSDEAESWSEMVAGWAEDPDA